MPSYQQRTAALFCAAVLPGKYYIGLPTIDFHFKFCWKLSGE